MKSILGFLALLIIIINQVSAKTIMVSASGTYKSISEASKVVNPGDTVFVEGGNYAGGDYISNLHGSSANWICFISDTNNPAIFKSGNTAFMMSDVSFIKISGFVMDGQTQNGVNIDDGGSYDTPTEHILIEYCKWLKMGSTGNNDELKMSGVDSFTVRKCTFQNGAAGGSMIDMVGCHYGVFEDNTFENGGSNCIQAKGGSQYIRIQRNRFINGGQRAINIGGSTDMQYFRPANADFEAQYIGVHSNVFIGSMAPVAYVGAVHCEVVNNTFIEPDRWIVRVLQENTTNGLQTCGKNKFSNNICYFSNKADNEKCINIGGGTAPKSFIFSNNLWYNRENSNWAGPNTAVQSFNHILNSDPKIKDISNKDFSLLEGSPAIGSGLELVAPELDYLGKKFKSPRSIGAIEYYKQNSINNENTQTSSFEIYPNPADDFISINLRGINPTLKRGFDRTKLDEYFEINIFNTLGEKVISESIHPMTVSHRMNIENLPKGMYFLRVGNQTVNFVKM